MKNIFSVLTFSMSLCLSLNVFALSADDLKDVLSRTEYHPMLSSIAFQAKKTTRKYSTHDCWNGVYFNHLKPLGMVDAIRNNPTRRYARFATNADAELKSFDFVNLMDSGQVLAGTKDICSAPAGAILIYGNRARGHSETKIGPVGQGEVSSDYRSLTPVTGGCQSSGNGFTLKAIMVPKAVAEYLKILVDLRDRNSNSRIQQADAESTSILESHSQSAGYVN